jgi:signal peptidase I
LRIFILGLKDKEFSKAKKFSMPNKSDTPNSETAALKSSPTGSQKEEWGDLAKTAALAVLLALLIRTFLFEPFNIPSGSMIPSLLVGDYLFVSKSSYGYSRYSFPLGLGGFEGRILSDPPKRGDVVVFKLPTDTSIDYIKRIVALPGETVQMKNGRLYINDKRIERVSKGLAKFDAGDGTETDVTIYQEILPDNIAHVIYEISDDEMLDNTDKFTVPDGHYFMMGDNRDNSQDSRVQDLVGFVPFENFVGRADRLFFSTNGSAYFYEFWKWPFAIRYDRLFQSIPGGDDLKAH